MRVYVRLYATPHVHAREAVGHSCTFEQYSFELSHPDPIQVFKKMDNDQSGFLTMTEFNNAMRLLNISCQKEDAEAVFKLFDTNADGRLSYLEFYRGILKDLDFQELMAMAEQQREEAKKREETTKGSKRMGRPRAATLPIMRSRTKSEESEAPLSPLPTPKVDKTRTEVSVKDSKRL